MEGEGDGLRAGTELEGEGDGVGDAEPQATVKVLVHALVAVTTNTGATTADSVGMMELVGFGVEATLTGVVGLRTKYTTPIARMAVRKMPRPIMSDFFICVVIVSLLPSWDHI